MKRVAFWCVLVLAGAGAAPPMAQAAETLAATYVRLCGGEDKADPETCAALLKGLESKRNPGTGAPAKGPTPTAEAPAPLVQPAPVTPDPAVWGNFLNFIDRTWITVQKSYTETHTYRWKVPGVVLLDEWSVVGFGGTNDRGVAEITFDPVKRLIGGMQLGPDGGVVTPPYSVSGKMTRVYTRSTGSDQWERLVQQQAKNGEWKTMAMGRYVFQRALSAREQQAAEQARRDHDARVQGFLNGALNVIGQVGAATQPGYDPLGTGAVGGGMGVPGGGGGGSGGMLNGNTLAGGQACAGFTEDNYQSYTLSRGDTQLSTMCANAFNLYAAYHRAHDQGHPQAEVTYQAFLKAAHVANSFYQNAR